MDIVLLFCVNGIVVNIRNMPNVATTMIRNDMFLSIVSPLNKECN